MSENIGTLPQAIEIEEAILGSILIDRDAAEIALSELSEQDFYQRSNALVFNALADLNNNGKPIDLVTLEHQLIEQDNLDKIGGAGYLVNLTRSVGSVGNIQYHVQILKDKSYARKLIAECQRVASELMDQADPYKAADSLAGLVEFTPDGIRALTPAEIRKRENEQPVRVPLDTGIYQLDNVMMRDGGNRPGQVLVVAGESGSGKTTLSQTIAGGFTEHGNRGLWIQCEDSDVATADYYLENHPNAADNLHISDSMRDVEAVKREARAIRRRSGLDFLVVDYIQELTSAKRHNSRAEEVEEVSRQLTALASELSLLVVLISQVTIADHRNGWNREPRLNDLRWSRQIKQAAHLILSVFRPAQSDELIKQIGDVPRVVDQNGDDYPYHSVYVRQVKNRCGPPVFKRLHLIHQDQGFRPYADYEKIEAARSNGTASKF